MRRKMSTALLPTWMRALACYRGSFLRNGVGPLYFSCQSTSSRQTFLGYATTGSSFSQQAVHAIVGTTVRHFAVGTALNEQNPGDACKKCNTPFNEESSYSGKSRWYCKACRALKPSEPVDLGNPEEVFGLFDLPVKFDISDFYLKEHYYWYMSGLHPDRYIGASAEDKKLSDEYSRVCTLAFRLLEDPIKRGQLVLKHRQALTEGGAKKLVGGNDKSLQRADAREISDAIDNPSLLNQIFDWEERAATGENVLSEVRKKLNVARDTFAKTIENASIKNAKAALAEWKLFQAFLDRRNE